MTINHRLLNRNMNPFFASDDLFKFSGDDERDNDSSTAVSTKKLKSTKSWAQIIEDKRRDFTPTNSKQKTRSSFSVSNNLLDLDGGNKKGNNSTVDSLPNNRKRTKSWTQIIQDKRRDFTPSNSKQTTRFSSVNNDLLYFDGGNNEGHNSTVDSLLNSCKPTKSWTQTIQDKRRDFTPTNSKQNTQYFSVSNNLLDLDGGNKEGNDSTIDSLPNSCKPTKSWTQTIQDKRRDFTPTNSKQNTRVSSVNNHSLDFDDENKEGNDSTIDSLPNSCKQTKIWTQIIQDKHRDFTPTRINHESDDMEYEISEFDSPKKKSQGLLACSEFNGGVRDEISEFDSPKKSERLLACSEFNSEKWTIVGGRQRKKRGLAQQVKGIVNRHESSVRMFSHDLKNGKYDEDSALPLVIRKLCALSDRLFWSICYDIKGQEDRCVVFKPHYQHEIIQGATLKLYQPWKEVSVPGVTSPVIICADFYRIIVKAMDLYPGITEEFINQVKSTTVLSSIKNFRMVPAEELKHIFYNLIPYRIKNKNTIYTQVNKFQSFVDLDIVIQNLWSTTSGCLVLIKDSDEIFGLLNVPDFIEELQHNLTPGRYIKFNKLGVSSKTTIFKDASLFSVLSVYGSKQVSYYNFVVRPDTQWSCELILEIPFGKMDCQTEFIHDMQQIGYFEDKRVAVECQIQSRTKNFITVIDKVGSRMKVELVSHSGSSAKQLFNSLAAQKYVVLKFLRIVQEKPILDQFSIIEELVQDDIVLEGDSGQP